jgi:hypothetical protein
MMHFHPHTPDILYELCSRSHKEVWLKKQGGSVWEQLA